MLKTIKNIIKSIKKNANQVKNIIRKKVDIFDEETARAIVQQSIDNVQKEAKENNIYVTITMKAEEDKTERKKCNSWSRNISDAISEVFEKSFYGYDCLTAGVANLNLKTGETNIEMYWKFIPTLQKAAYVDRKSVCIDLFETFVRHELRHIAQYKYLIKTIGLKETEKLLKEMNSKVSYNEDPMEKDAYEFQFSGKDLSKVNEGLENLIAELKK